MSDNYDTARQLIAAYRDRGYDQPMIGWSAATNVLIQLLDDGEDVEKVTAAMNDPTRQAWSVAAFSFFIRRQQTEKPSRSTQFWKAEPPATREEKDRAIQEIRKIRNQHFGRPGLTPVEDLPSL